MARLFLICVGIAYIGLGIWCAASPESTSNAVGFELKPGSGQSEFLTVYGGLEVGLGLVFLWPLFRPDEVRFPLAVCVVVHASLVGFRTLGFFLYSDVGSTTWILAAIEWSIFVSSAVVFRRCR